MPRFSVIIPTYNRCELLQEALASVWAQTFTDYEVIVVDDGSTDGTWEYLQSLGSRVRAFGQQNAGPGAARNLAAQHASGDYLAFLDSDDLWLPWSLQAYAELIARYDSPAFMAGKPYCFEDRATLSEISFSDIVVNQFKDYFSSSEAWRWWGVSSFVIRADSFRDVGGFSAASLNGEDADLSIKLGTAPWFLQVVSPPTFGYRVHASNLTNDQSKSLAGLSQIIHTEQTGAYPGGQARARQRREIITRHIRPVVLECLDNGLRKKAWALYRDTLLWHLSLRRWKFLVGFWIKLFTARA